MIQLIRRIEISCESILQVLQLISIFHIDNHKYKMKFVFYSFNLFLTKMSNNQNEETII